MNIELTERQAKTVATAITAVAGAVTVLLIVGVFYLLVLFAKTFSNVFMPLVVGFLLAFVLQPVYRFFATRMKLPPAASVGLVFLTILLPLVFFSWFFGAIIVTQVAELVRKAPELSENMRRFAEENWPQVRELWDRYGLAGRAEVFLAEQGEALWQAFRNLMQSAASASASAFRSISGALGWLILPVYLGFFLMTPPLPKDRLEEYLPFLKPQTRKDLLYLIEEFINILVSFFRGQLIVAFGQGVLYAIGFAVVGLNYGIAIGLLLGFLNIIPYLGAMIGLAVTIPLALFQPGGGAVLLALVLAVIVIVQLIESYYLTPKVMGERTGLHPLVIIVALFFWGTAFDGLAGMILAIPLTAFLVVFWRLARAKYIQEIV